MNPRPPPPAEPSRTFRSLVWHGSIPVQVSLHDADLPRGCDRTVDSYYIQAPRISYLPLLLPLVHKHLVQVVLDESSALSFKTDDMWFEWHDIPLRWHWPLGLLYDYYTANNNNSSSSSNLPFHITLHLSHPPLDKLFHGPSVETSRSNFMNMIKEADFVRCGNTRRVTALRRVDQDALWESVVEHDLDKYWSIASKLMPSPSSVAAPLASPTTYSSLSSSTKSPPPPSQQQHNNNTNNNNISNTLSASQNSNSNNNYASQQQPPSSSSSSSSSPSPFNTLDIRSMKSVPMKVYLPEAPVVQDVFPPILDDGRPATLYDTLSTTIPVLFPSPKPFAKPIIHGIEIPLEAELGWLSATMSGADGWLSVIIKLV